jgi:hypothetical protein
MNRRLALVIMAMVLSGCAIKQQVERAELSSDAMLCVIENKEVREGFLPELQKVLQEKGIKHSVVDAGYAQQHCEWTLTYIARWSWDLTIYMSYAEINVFKGGVLDGRAVYDSTGGSMNFSKFIDAEPKIRELVEQLIQSSSAS